MSTDNRHSHIVDAGQPQTPPSAEDQILTIIRPIIGNTVNGLLLTLRGIHPEIIQKLTARAVGEIVGSVLVNNVSDIAGVFKLRSIMKDEFSNGIGSVAIRPQAMPKDSLPGAGVRKTG